MNPDWAVSLSADRGASLAPLRLLAGLEVCVEGATLWLRGPEAGEALERRLRQLPADDWFRVLADGQLVPTGKLVPRGRLPEGPWQPLSQWLRVQLPPARTTENRPGAVRLTLVPSGAEAEPALLLTTLEAWRAYGETAPQIRLNRWTFAVGEGGMILVRGTPLPPLPGRRFVERQGIAVPAGWAWAPPLEAEVVREVLGLGKGDVALLHEDGRWDRLPAEQFVPARRSAIRLSTGLPDST